MPNVRASSGMIGTTCLPNCSSRARLRSRRVKPIVVLTTFVPEPFASSSNDASAGSCIGAADLGDPLRDRAAERTAALHHVLVLDRVLGRPEVRELVVVERRLGDLVVEVQAVAQREQLILGHLLDLVRGVAALDLRAERPALDRLAEDHRRRARCRGCRWPPCTRRRACDSRGRRGAGCAGRRR